MGKVDVYFDTSESTPTFAHFVDPRWNIPKSLTTKHIYNLMKLEIWMNLDESGRI